MNKLFYLIIFLGVSFNISPAQNKSANISKDDPKISVDKLKWEKRTQMPNLLANSPFDASNPSVSMNPNMPPPSSMGRLRDYYVYQGAFKNSGEKEIRGIVWEYIFTDPDSKQELGRHKFLSYVKIKPNETKTVADRAISPPSRIVSAKGLETNGRSPYIERVEIKCVQYKEDSMWSSPRAQRRECEFLRYVVKRKHRPIL